MNNIFQYAAACESMFENYLKEQTGYKRITTFYSDLSIAEVYGVGAIKETYNRVMKSWLKDIKYITEFCMALNIKSWQMAEEGKNELGQLYSDLYYKCRDAIYKKYENDSEKLNYFFETTD